MCIHVRVYTRPKHARHHSRARMCVLACMKEYMYVSSLACMHASGQEGLLRDTQRQRVTHTDRASHTQTESHRERERETDSRVSMQLRAWTTVNGCVYVYVYVYVYFYAIYIYVYICIDKQIDRQIDRQTDRWIERYIGYRCS